MKQVGDVAKAINKLEFERVNEELVQAAAVIESWISVMYDPEEDE